MAAVIPQPRALTFVPSWLGSQFFAPPSPVVSAQSLPRHKDPADRVLSLDTLVFASISGTLLGPSNFSLLSDHCWVLFLGFSLSHQPCSLLCLPHALHSRPTESVLCTLCMESALSSCPLSLECPSSELLGQGPAEEPAWTCPLSLGHDSTHPAPSSDADAHCTGTSFSTAFSRQPDHVCVPS